MDDTNEDFAGITPSYTMPTSVSYSEPVSITNNLITGNFRPEAYSNSTTPYYAPLGSGGGGGAVDSVSAGAGLVVSPTTGAVIVSMPNVGTAGAVSNPASITTDAQGRVSSITSLGYTPVNPTALNAYAPLAGATFTGAVSGITPTANANLTTKLYVDNAVAGGGSGVYLPLAGGTMTGDINMSGNELTFVSKISNATGDLDLSGNDVNIRQLDAGTEELPNVLNITSAGATAIASGGAITCSAVGAVNLTSGLSTTIYSTNGTVKIGGPINNITVESNGTSVSGVSDLTASGEISAQSLDISAGALVGGGLQASTLGATNGITATGNVNLSGASSVSVPLVPTLAGQATSKEYVDNKASTTPSPFISKVNSFTFTSPSSYTIADTDCVGGAIFLINTGAQLGGCPVLLPASSQILPVGTTVIVQCLTTNNVLVNVSEAVGGGAFRNNNVYAGGSLQCVVSSVGGPTSTPPYQITWTNGKTFNSISLDGTEVGQPVVGPVIFDTTSNIQCLDIQTGLISALDDVNFVSVESPLQTRTLGVRSSDGLAPAEIAMALSETATPSEILTMTYNPLANDKLEVNKGMILDGGLIMGAGGGVNNIENVLGLYSSEIVESKTLQAIDINTIGDGSITLKTTDPLFPEGTVVSMTYPDATTQNSTLYVVGALSLDNPPNGGLPAQILINGVPQTFGSADWSNNPAVSNVDMASYDIDNAGAIGATSLTTTDFITSDTTITALDVVVNNTLTAGANINIDATTGNILATTINTTDTIDSDTTISALDMVATASMTAENIQANASLSVAGLDVQSTLLSRPTNELFVALNGDDINGNGSYLKPYATIQYAIDNADLTTPKTGVSVINVANGTYNDPISITGANSGYIQINGASTSQNNTFGVVLKGGININIDSGPADRINRQVIFSGVQIESIIDNTSTLEHTVIIQNCRLYPQASTLGRIINDSNTASTGNRVLIDNCEYTNDYGSTPTPQSPFEFTGNSTISFSKCDIQSPTVSPIIQCGGTSFFQRLENCYIESQYNTPTQPLVSISSTSSSAHNIALNVFSFTTGTGTTTPAIITFNGGTVFLVSNNFNLVGTNPSTGNCIGYTGTAPTLIYGNNSAVPLYASGVQSGITLVPVAGVGSQPITATTITASGAITGGSLSAGSGTISTTGAITGATLTTTGLIKSSGTLQLSGNVISNASNNTTITGLNGITMAGTTPSITGVNSLAISNTNATTPLTITNSGDNPHIICNNGGASTTVPVEINLINGSTTLAYGNQGADPRGAFFFFNGRDCIRIPTTGRVQMTYSPYSPTLATSGTAGAFVAGTGSFVSGVPKLLGTQTITLGVNNLPIIAGGFGTQCYIGLNGFLNTCILNGAHNFQITATYTRNRASVITGPFALYGCSYPIESRSDGAFYSPLNGTTYNEAVVGERITFTHGDIITISVFGLFVGGSPPTITTPATGLASVFSPFFF